MGARLHEPGVFATTSVGRVYAIRYRVATTVEIERRISADFEGHRAIVGRSLNLALFEHSVVPLPSVEVRAHWRASMDAGAGVDAVAAVTGGFVGLTSAAITTMLEHLIDPRFGIRFRVFTELEPALAWLTRFELGASEAELSEALRDLQALP